LLWTSSAGSPVSFDGSYYHLSNAFLSQPPKQKPHPPIYVGVLHSIRGLELVGREGDGWYSWLNTPQTFQKCWRVIKEAASSASRKNLREIEPWSNLMIAFPRNSKEEKSAILSAKTVLLVERAALASFGYAESRNLEHHQNIHATSTSVHALTRQAQILPDEYAYRVAAIGTDGVNEKIEEFAKVGLRNFALVDLLAPQTMKRSIKTAGRVIRQYKKQL